MVRCKNVYSIHDFGHNIDIQMACLVLGDNWRQGTLFLLPLITFYQIDH